MALVKVCMKNVVLLQFLALLAALGERELAAPKHVKGLGILVVSWKSLGTALASRIAALERPKGVVMAVCRYWVKHRGRCENNYTQLH